MAIVGYVKIFLYLVKMPESTLRVNKLEFTGPKRRKVGANSKKKQKSSKKHHFVNYSISEPELTNLEISTQLIETAIRDTVLNGTLVP